MSYTFDDTVGWQIGWGDASVIVMLIAALSDLHTNRGGPATDKPRHARRGRRTMIRSATPAAEHVGPSAQTKRLTRTSPLQRSMPATHDVARRVALIAILVTVSLSLADLAEVAFFPPTSDGIRAALLGFCIAIPLHLRHLVYGARGERPPAGVWTLIVLAAATIAGAILGGPAWMRELAPLAVSILIVVPSRLGIVLAAGAILAPLVLVNAHWHSTPMQQTPGIYCVLAVAWRTLTQFVPLRLLTSLRALDAANHELEARAVVQTRIRIDAELRRSIGPALRQIIVAGGRARAIAASDKATAAAELRGLSAGSRGALANTRAIVASYRTSTVRAELDAAVARLEATGASVDVVTTLGTALDSSDANARENIRLAVGEALRSDPSPSYRMELTHNAVGDVCVALAPADELVVTSRLA